MNSYIHNMYSNSELINSIKLQQTDLCMKG
jgi:serine/threonine protein kinase